MGRQVGLYLMEGDCGELVEALRRGGRQVRFAPMNAATSALWATDEPCQTHAVWCVWDTAVLPDVARTFVRESTRGPYYRMDDGLPTLEFDYRRTTTWDGRPALSAGRLFLLDPAVSPAVTDWYTSIVRWVRRSYRPNPWVFLGGYVGPHAWRWHQATGGIFMPSIIPPVTPEWRAVIDQPERKSWQRGPER